MRAKTNHIERTNLPIIPAYLLVTFSLLLGEITSYEAEKPNKRNLTIRNSKYVQGGKKKGNIISYSNKTKQKKSKPNMERQKKGLIIKNRRKYLHPWVRRAVLSERPWCRSKIKLSSFDWRSGDWKLKNPTRGDGMKRINLQIFGIPPRFCGYCGL